MVATCSRDRPEKNMAEARDDFIPAAVYGRSLKGLGLNLLVRDIDKSLTFLRDVLQVDVVYANPDFAVLAYEDRQWMLHADHTYHSNPLLALTGDGALRGVGVELHLYGTDPDAAEARARDAGYHVLQEATNKPHGLRECYLVDPDGYVWVPSRPIPDEELP
jgi:catechol 2,3-dioxygenase-like lactoylglutathione lyase family enzyme